jgi:hypothetical protein
VRWELHQSAALRSRYGPAVGADRADRLRALLAANGVPLPPFPGMAWAEDWLPTGEAVAVGVAETDQGPLAYVYLRETVEFDRTEPLTLEEPTPGGPRPVTLHRFVPGQSPRPRG